MLLGIVGGTLAHLMTHSYMFVICAQYRNTKGSGQNLSNVPEREAVKYDDLIGRDGTESVIISE